MDIGDKKLELSVRTVTSIIGALLVGGFIAGVGWFSLDSQVKAASIDVATLKRDVCQLKNFMINGVKPHPYDGCK